MNKIIVLLSTLLLSASMAMAQLPANLSVYWGYGSYSMQDLKHYQQTSREGMPFNAKATDRFPPHFLYGLKYMFRSPVEDRYGIVAEMGSTGGRIAYADYSGSYQFDQLLRYKRVGMVLERQQPLPLGFTAWLGFELSVLHSTLIFEEQMAIKGSGKVSDSYTFYAWGGSLQPMASLEKQIGKMSVGLQAGLCLFSVSETFHLKGEREAKLTNMDRENQGVSPGWGGFRLGLRAGYTLGKAKQPEFSF